MARVIAPSRARSAGAASPRSGPGPLVAALSAAVLLAACSAAPVKITSGGETRFSDHKIEPIAPAPSTEPELAFCVDETPGALERFRSHAPFRRIGPVGEDTPCDVRLVLRWTFVDGSGTVVALSAEDGTELLRGEAEGVWGPVFGVERLGPVVYNAFAPGSPLYRKVVDARKAEEAAFAEAVRTFRAARPRPDLPEEARRFKVQAEAAFNRKELDEAAARYLDALRVAPWWPEGHFNRALILGDTGHFRMAIGEMRKYLALAPDAPDARAAQDKVYEWEGLAGRKK